MEPVIIDAGTLEFSEEDMAASGLLIPFGVQARSNLGMFTFAAGDVHIPADLTGMSLNVEHKRENVVGGFTRAWEQAEQALADKLPADFPVPARYAHPIVLRRMIRILREGRAQTAPEALEVLKADLKALNASVQVEQAEYDEVVAIKPMFLLHEYK